MVGLNWIAARGLRHAAKWALWRGERDTGGNGGVRIVTIGTVVRQRGAETHDR